MRILQLFVLMLLAAPALALVDLPPAMTDMAYDDAIEQNEEQASRLLIVKFTAEWCGPCKMMDRTTWSDEGTIDYLKDHNITVIAVDVDEEPLVAGQNQIRAMPTMVVFKGGEEFDRQVGSMNSEKLVDWLDDLRDGRTHTQAMVEQMRDRKANRDQLSMMDRLSFARDLVSAGELDEATREYVWLWNNMLNHDRAMTGVRVSFMISDMKELAEQHPPAKEAFTKLRDDLTQQLKTGKRSRDNLSDWLVLNIRLLDDDQLVEDWVERIKDSETAGNTIRSMGRLLQDWLLEHGYWKLAGESLRSASTVIAREIQMRELTGDRMYQDFDEEMANRLRTQQQLNEVQNFAQNHAAYLAAGRDDDAWELLDWMIKDYPNAIVAHEVHLAAQSAGVVRDRHEQLLKAAGEAGEG